MRPALEVADVFRRHGEAFRAAQGGRLLPHQRRVMAAIAACRTATLGGHVEQCNDCGMIRIAYNSCRDRHCPKCQGLARAEWLADRQADLLPAPYFHVVFTVPAPTNLAHLAEPTVFAQHLGALRNVEWNVYAKRPFGGPQQVLEYLGRYTHRVAIANSRLVACEDGNVCFRWKDYRANNKSKVMKLEADEFMRRFLLHVLPKGFRRIRHFGFLANACRTAKLAVIRAALQAPQPAPTVEHTDYRQRYAILTGHRLDLCPLCGGSMVEIGLCVRSSSPPFPAPRCDTS